MRIELTSTPPKRPCSPSNLPLSPGGAGSPVWLDQKRARLVLSRVDQVVAPQVLK